MRRDRTGQGWVGKCFLRRSILLTAQLGFRSLAKGKLRGDSLSKSPPPPGPWKSCLTQPFPARPGCLTQLISKNLRFLVQETQRAIPPSNTGLA